MQGIRHDSAANTLCLLFERLGLKSGYYAVERAVGAFEDAGHPVVLGIHGTFLQERNDVETGIFFQESVLFAEFISLLRADLVFIVGNGFGWSAILAGMAGARVVCIDNDEKCIGLTNDMAKSLRLPVEVVHGESPGGVVDIFSDNERRLSGIDICLIDAEHKSHCAFADYEAAKEFCHEDTLFLFHDVLSYNLRAALEKTTGPVREVLGLESGMGISTSEKTYRKIETITKNLVQQGEVNA